MNLRLMAALMRMPDRIATALLLRDSQSYSRSSFLLAASRTGLIGALARPSTRSQLVERLGIEDPTQLGLLLDLGVALGELGLTHGRYSLRGRRARALAGARGEVLEALLAEMLYYHGAVFTELPGRLRTSGRGDYLAEHARTIAKSSLVIEPIVATFLADVARESGPRVLDVGCGSGEYLGAVAEALPTMTGVGVDLQADAVDVARQTVARRGIADRVEIVHGDARDLDLEVHGEFDLVYLLNNMYYFTSEERVELFRSLATRLRHGGTMTVVSLFHGDTPSGLALDLVLASTNGCYALPNLEDVVAELRAAGLTVTDSRSLVPGHSVHAILATASRQPAPARTAKQVVAG